MVPWNSSGRTDQAMRVSRNTRRRRLRLLQQLVLEELLYAAGSVNAGTAPYALAGHHAGGPR